MDRLLTVREVAERLRTSPQFVYRLVAERRIAFHHVGRGVRFMEADVESFVASGRVEVITVRWRNGRMVS